MLHFSCNMRDSIDIFQKINIIKDHVNNCVLLLWSLGEQKYNRTVPRRGYCFIFKLTAKDDLVPQIHDFERFISRLCSFFSRGPDQLSEKKHISNFKLP